MRTPLIAATLLLALPLLAGCAAPEPIVTPVPQPSSTPLFANDAEALKAATDAYAAYQQAVDAALSTYDTSQLVSVATGKALSTAKSSVKRFQDAGERQVGASVVSQVSAVDLSPFLDPRKSAQEAQIYGCLDVTEIDVVDSSGSSVVSPERPATYPEIVTLQWDSTVEAIKVSSDDVWTGSDFCG